jgi:hypothetical protein
MRRLGVILLCFVSVFAQGLEPAQVVSEGRAAHRPMRFELEGGYADAFGAFLGVGYRFGLHDFLDPLFGFPEHTAFELGVLKLRLPLRATRFWLDELVIARIGSLPPADALAAERSWELELGARTEREQLCDHCVAGYMRAGIGYTVQPLPIPLHLFVLADIDLSYGPGYGGWPIKPGIGPHAGIRWRLSQALFALFDGRYLYKFPADFPHVWDYGATLRWAPFEHFAIQGRVRRYVDTWEAAASVSGYF